jgi:hypothetical protein
MNPIEAIRLMELWKKFQAVTKEKGSFMTKILQYAHLAVTLAGVIGVPTLAQGWLNQPGHAGIFAALVGLSVVLHAICPSIFGGPSDAAQAAAATATQKLGVWALIALLLPLPFMAGCNGVKVAQDIVNWTPALQSAVGVANSACAILGPADAAICAAATVGFDAGSNLVVAQAKTYLANPNATFLAELQAQVVAFQQNVNTALLQAAKITNSASQQHVLQAIGAVAAIVNAMLALVESISSKAQVARMAAASTIKLAQVEPYLDRAQEAGIVARHYGEPVELARIQMEQSREQLVYAGF